MVIRSIVIGILLAFTSCNNKINKYDKNGNDPLKIVNHTLSETQFADIIKLEEHCCKLPFSMDTNQTKISYIYQFDFDNESENGVTIYNLKFQKTMNDSKREYILTEKVKGDKAVVIIKSTASPDCLLRFDLSLKENEWKINN